MASSRSSASASSGGARSARGALGALAALVALAVLAGEARAERRVAVLDFRGPSAARFQRDVERLVRSDHTVIAARRYQRTARTMKATRRTPRNVKRVAARLRLDAVVTGQVSRRRGRLHLELRVLSAATGRQVGETITASVRSPGLAGQPRRQVARRLGNTLSDVPRSRPERVDVAPDARAGTAAAGRAEAREVPPAAREDRAVREPAPASGAERRGASSREAEEPPAVREVAPPADDAILDDRRARSRALELQVGLTAVSRNLRFSSAESLGEDAPQGYEGNLVAAFLLAGDLYPLAFDLGTSSPKRNIGVTGVFERVFKIRSTVPGRPDIALPTAQQRLGVGPVFRMNFGSKPTAPTVKVSVRFNRAHFHIDRGPAEAMNIEIELPNVDYTYLDPGAALRLPLGSKLAVNAEARFLLATKTGEIQENSRYGGANVTGFDADLNLELHHLSPIVLRAGARVMGFAFDFNGEGALTDRNNDGVQDIGGAFDRYLGVYATGGYRF